MIGYMDHARPPFPVEPRSPHQAEVVPVPRVLLAALSVGLRYRLVPSSCVMVVVPKDLRSSLNGNWPGVIVAGRFCEGPSAGSAGVWVAGASARLSEGIVDVRPVVAIGEAAREWSLWSDRLHPVGKLHRSVDEVIASGLIDVVLDHLDG